MSRGRKPRAERPEPSRKQLMVAAIDCFARLGYQGTTIARIARDAGVTKGAVYYHFRDKEELLFETVKDRRGGSEQHVLEKVTPTPDALTRLREVVDACFFHATVSNHRRFIITLMIEALDTNPRLSGEFRDILRRMRGFLATVILRGQQKGTLRADVVPEAAAAVIMGGIIGAEVQHYQDPEEIDLRRVLDTLVEQLSAWLATGSSGAGCRVSRATSSRSGRRPSSSRAGTSMRRHWPPALNGRAATTFSPARSVWCRSPRAPRGYSSMRPRPRGSRPSSSNAARRVSPSASARRTWASGRSTRSP